MMPGPSAEQVRDAREAGKSAARTGLPFRECPYIFERTGVAQPVFTEQYRPLLNAWFDGWYGARFPNR